MSEYTPTPEEVRGRHNANATLDGRTWRMADAEFDRWLAAHDAEVRAQAEAVAAMSAYDDGYTAGEAAGRAGVVAEEPEPPKLIDARDPECVKAWPECESMAYDPACCRFPKSCSAGGWVPVKQGDET